ncbi:MAG: DUF1800 family protein [Bacteroidota bacterium]
MDQSKYYLFWLLLLQLVAFRQNAQVPHLDFLGAGHTNNVSVTTSSASNGTAGDQTIDGFDIENEEQLKDASRFLAQATFGTDFATIQMTAAMGYEAWLDEQFALPTLSVMERMHRQNRAYDAADGLPEESVYSGRFRSAWLTNNLTSPDLLRQRMAFNLSQIMVINDNSDLFTDVGNFVGYYYDMLLRNSFGQYKNLMMDVTLSPAMGIFLSHINNPKANEELNIRPDENYAREIMQLFSIGLWELNPNGTRKYDSNGQFIPTYNNDDIKEFAQVFTGLGSNGEEAEFGTPPDDLGGQVAAVRDPMQMYEEQHDTSEKHLLNGVVLPANQPGLVDIEQTIDHLATHPNTAPFIAKALIQMFTTSNPSPSYVQAVASVFQPTEPGNFQQVLRTILLHPQARTCNTTEGYTFGKLRAPIVRLMNFYKAFQLRPNAYHDFMNELYCFGQNTGQAPMAAPSVFNFYLPDYAPQGPISQSYLVAPEFQILNSTNAIGAINEVEARVTAGGTYDEFCVEGEEIPDVGEDDGFPFLLDDETVDYEGPLELIDDTAALLNYLDILLANGMLTDTTKAIIGNAINQLQEPGERLKLALYLILISPDYVILK